MAKGRRSARELAAELDAVSARLQEAEDALRAIRGGEVDALIVTGPEGDQVFTLKSADHLYRMFVEAMNEGAVTLSEDGLILFCNRAFAGILKTPPEQVVGATFASFLPAADLPVFQALLEPTEGGRGGAEVSVRAATKVTVPLRLSLTRLRAVNAGVACIVATDMTETRRRQEDLRRAHDQLEQRVAERTASLADAMRKLEFARVEALATMEEAIDAQRALESANVELREQVAQRRQAEKRSEHGLSLLKATLESTADGILVVDREGNTVSFNQVFARLWRLPESVLASGDDRSLLAFVIDQVKDPDGFLSGVRAIYAQPEAESFDTVDFLDGRAFERFSKPQRAEGKVIGRVWSFRDITKRRQAEEKLRDSEDRYRRLFESNPHPMWVHDAETLRFLAVNDAAISHYGYSRDEFLRMTMRDIHASAVRAPLEGSLDAPAGSGEQTGHSMHAKKDGSVIDVEVTSHSLEFDGRPSRLVLALDITERRKLDAIVRDSLHEKESLLREVHHRVKNNLQVITSLLRMEARRSGHPTTQSVLQDMRNRIMAMAALHESLYRTGTFASVDLGAYLRQLASQSFQAMVFRPGAVQLEIDTASVQVEMDEALPCGLLVSELISNCLKHGFPGSRTGSVRLELQPVDGGPLLRLRVSDDGAGLPADFEARRENSLGLQLVSSLSAQIGGRLDIGPPPGSSFSVTFRPRRSDIDPARPMA
jgi:PAS domain S-box-containing protein